MTNLRLETPEPIPPGQICLAVDWRTDDHIAAGSRVVGDAVRWTLMMADKKREMPAEEMLTLAQARAKISTLKPMPRIDGRGGGAAVPPKGISKSRKRNVKR